MASRGESPLGDVINFDSSSENEVTPAKKRRHRDSEASAESASSERRSKRVRTEPTENISSSASPGSEEGEIGERDSQYAQNPPKDSSGAFVPPDAPLFTHESLTLRLAVFSNKREGSWSNRFKDWANIFCQNNSALSAAITPSLVYTAYCHYIDNNSGLVSKKKKSAKQTAKQLEKSGTLSAWLQNFRNMPGSKVNAQVQPHQTKVPGTQLNQTRASATIDLVSENEDEYEPSPDIVQVARNGIIAENNGKPVDVPQIVNTLPSDNEVQHMRRYFPSASDQSSMCLLCGRAGHTSDSCPHTACKFCNAKDHWDFCCPTRERCSKCRQLGHGKTSCSEKLALTRDEGLACGFCNSVEHFEENCTDIWRSFVPDSNSTKAVVYITPTCSSCGSAQHFSADCANRRGQVAGNPTWSLRNSDRYVDQGCNISAIEDKASSKQSRASELKIRGQAARKANTVVHYSSDDSDVEFLGNKAVKKQLPSIRMSSNIQMTTSLTGNGRPNRGQPPLPLGPPPGPPRGQGSFSQLRGPLGASSQRQGVSGPPPSLPPKPPTTRDYRNVPPPPQMQARGPQRSQYQDENPRGGQFRGGQRGGRGGRGGGRGRGGRGKKF